MRIRELKLVNYRPFAESPDLIFGDRFTVIAGVNGRGKTAILDSIALLLSRLLPHISAARSGYRAIYERDIHLNSEMTKLAMKVNCVGIPFDYDLTFNRTDRKVVTKKLPSSLKQQVRNAYGDPNRSDDAAPLVVYYTTDRAGYRLPKQLPKEVPRGQAAAYAGALFNRTINFRDFMARYRATVELSEEQHNANVNYLGKSAMKAIAQALESFLGGFTNLRVQEDPLRMLIDKDGVTLDITQLSDGERAFLAVICDLVRRLTLANPLLPNPLTGAGVVLIDELELHLHPKWQREVADKLRKTFPNIQFIATTHSPFIVQSLRNDELILLDDKIIGDFENRGLEEVTTKVMGIEDPNVTPRYRDMLNTAKEYFQTLNEIPKAEHSKIATLKRKLTKLSHRYADNPAYQAFLEMQRVKTLKE